MLASISPKRFPFLHSVERAVKNIFVFFLRFFFRSIPPEEIQLDKVTAILVVRQHDQLGDMLCAVPLLRALRTRFPSAHITLVANPVNYDIMRHHPFLNEVLNYDKLSFYRNPFKLLEFVRALRKQRYEIAVVPATVSISLTSNLLALISRAAVRIGPESLPNRSNPTSFLLHIKTKLDWSSDLHRHQSLRTMDILKPLQVSTADLSHRIGINEQEKLEATRFLASFKVQRGVLVGLHPGAGKAPNRWPAERFTRLADLLFERFSAGAVITSGPMDDEPVHVMLRHIRAPHLVVRKKPIREVAAIISQLSLFVTNDTGIMHIAAGVGTPTLSLFGPTDPLQWAPFGEKNRFIKSEGEDIRGIAVEKVFSATVEMLAQRV